MAVFGWSNKWKEDVTVSDLLLGSRWYIHDLLENHS